MLHICGFPAWQTQTKKMIQNKFDVCQSKDQNETELLQVIFSEINCAIFHINLHELVCQFISWTNWVNSGQFMDNCWISSYGWCEKSLWRSHNYEPVWIELTLTMSWSKVLLSA